MMKKVITVITLLLALSVCGCNQRNIEDNSTAEKTVTDKSNEETNEELASIKMTLVSAAFSDPEHHTHAACLAFEAYVEEKSNGKIDVIIAAGGAPGGVLSIQKQTMEGIVEACTSVTEGSLSTVYPDIQAIAVPYLFKSVDHAIEVLHGPAGQELYEGLREATNLRAIAIWDNGGFRCFTNNVRPIRTPKDLEGLRIRTMDTPAHMELVKALGGSPTSISWMELYSALETGIVEGQENAIPIILQGLLHEVQKYMTLDNHVFSVVNIVVNDEWFSSLPEEYQQIILEGGKVAEQKGLEINAKQREKGIEILRESMEIYEPTEEELDLFKEATQDKVLQFIQEEMYDKSLLEKIINAAEDTQ